ncbi:hypothetical protein E5161_16660 [Cohnella pontilimi]|uniref:Aromatic acid exporter family protein n=1 Tax=Cohnella pontilimi TaxID=2564100 RepID=A0A4U0F7U9_9BACL|nr:aromatic acid exporter family protein [Cohnella pontilimi]TJY40775.1 hypothetical protein E5161_16660 [Cohnella pontilimi]
MTVGARVLKTGLAVAVALWVATTIAGFNSPIISAVAAIFTIQPSIYRSWKELLQQVQSNMLGAAVAVAAVWLIGNKPIAVGLVCICVILLCLRLKAEETIGLTLVTVVVIMEARGQTGWNVALDRFAAIMTGMLSAFAVNVAVAPPRHRERFVKLVQDAQSSLSRLLRTAISNELKENVFRDELKRVRKQLRQLQEYYELFAEERVWRAEARVARGRLLVVYKGMMAALEQGLALLEAVEQHYFAIPTAQAWNRLIDRQIEALCGYHELLMWKWEGQLKPGANASAPPDEATALLTDMIAERSEQTDAVSRARLLVLTSSLFSYEDRLRRLDKLIERWLQREEPVSIGEIDPRASD